MKNLHPFFKDFVPEIRNNFFVKNDEIEFIETLLLFKKYGIDVYSVISEKRKGSWYLSEDFKKIYIENATMSDAESFFHLFVHKNRKHFLGYIAKERIKKL